MSAPISRLQQASWKIRWEKLGRPPPSPRCGRIRAEIWATSNITRLAATGFYRLWCTSNMSSCAQSPQIWCIVCCNIIWELYECSAQWTMQVNKMHITYCPDWQSFKVVIHLMKREAIKTIGKKSLSALTIRLILTPCCCCSDIWQIGSADKQNKRGTSVYASGSKGLLRFYDLVAASRHSSNLHKATPLPQGAEGEEGSSQ